MRLTILTLAHDISYSEPGKLLNIAGIYSGITAPSFPFVIPRILLVARFTGSPAEYGREFEVMVNFVDQDGLPGPIPSDRKNLHMKVGQSGEDVHADYTLEALDTTFHQSGWYQFFIHVNGAQIDELPVNVALSIRR
ncbi:MAG TPA: hypothetical protein VHD90_14110 [Phototrophicaceae bacterium]|nr:hypothetical protein [Phototrophicaceae bacterium]